jgi:hypothetical protein
VIAAPLWLVGAGKAVWTFLKSVPWWVFAGAAALIVGWWQVSAYGERQYEAGRIACQTEWDAQRARDDAEAVRRQREAEWLLEGPAYTISILGILAEERRLTAIEHGCLDTLREKGVIR